MTDLDGALADVLDTIDATDAAAERAAAARAAAPAYWGARIDAGVAAWARCTGGADVRADYLAARADVAPAPLIDAYLDAATRARGDS